jgi:hypothetical protein
MGFSLSKNKWLRRQDELRPVEVAKKTPVNSAQHAVAGNF